MTQYRLIQEGFRSGGDPDQEASVTYAEDDRRACRVSYGAWDVEVDGEPVGLAVEVVVEYDDDGPHHTGLVDGQIVDTVVGPDDERYELVIAASS